MHIALSKKYSICNNLFDDLNDEDTDFNSLTIRFTNADIQSNDVFDINTLNKYVISSYKPLVKRSDGVEFRDVHYIASDENTSENEYLDLLSTVLNIGKKRIDRTNVGTIAVFSRQMHFDISKSVPFLTTKFLPWKSVIKELLWFIRGDTNSKILEKQGVNIWKDNSSREFLDARGLTQYEVGDIGPMYGYNWRNFGYEYSGCDTDYSGKGFDQIKNLIVNLIAEPFSRRHMITTFNPSIIEQSCLAPCHGIVCQFYVEEDENDVRLLSCHIYNRSQDMFLGVPFNIASYAVLVYIIAKLTDMKPNELIVSTGDTHIYNTHIEQVKEQLKRTPLAQPVLVVSDTIKNKELEEITIDDFELIGYCHHAAIKAPMAI